MTDPAPSQVPSQPSASPPQLEARIAALEKSAQPSDFDAASWCWMALLGIAIPLALLAVGWWA
jgi:hypothetical protein